MCAGVSYTLWWRIGIVVIMWHQLIEPICCPSDCGCVFEHACCCFCLFLRTDKSVRKRQKREKEIEMTIKMVYFRPNDAPTTSALCLVKTENYIATSLPVCVSLLPIVIIVVVSVAAVFLCSFVHGKNIFFYVWFKIFPGMKPYWASIFFI